jgi:hypothetical protein
MDKPLKWVRQLPTDSAVDGAPWQRVAGRSGVPAGDSEPFEATSPDRIESTRFIWGGPVKRFDDAPRHQQGIHFADNLDGTEANETVEFSIDGTEYQIDLSRDNAAKLRKVFDDYVPKSRSLE